MHALDDLFGAARRRVGTVAVLVGGLMLAMVAPMAQAGAPGMLNAQTSDPSQVVRNFLTSFQRDRSGHSSTPYLSRDLLAQVQGGQPMSAILGTENIDTAYGYQSFSVAAATVAGGTATSAATLTFFPGSGGSIQRTFTLTEENGAWKITAVTVPATRGQPEGPAPTPVMPQALPYTGGGGTAGARGPLPSIRLGLFGLATGLGMRRAGSLALGWY